MSRGVNKVILVGNLGQKPEMRYTATRSAVANISIATTESWKDKESGEMRDKTEWHKVVYFGKLAEIVEKYLDKGSSVYIEGKLQTRKWQDQSGQDRYTTEVVISGFSGTLQMLDRRDDSNSPMQSQPQSTPQPAQNAQQTPSITPVAQDEFEDDIPF